MKVYLSGGVWAALVSTYLLVGFMTPLKAQHTSEEHLGHEEGLDPDLLNRKTRRFYLAWNQFQKSPSPDTLEPLLNIPKIAPSVIEDYAEVSEFFMRSVKRLCEDDQYSYRNQQLLARFFFEFPSLDSVEIADICDRDFLYEVKATAFAKRWVQYAKRPTPENLTVLFNFKVGADVVDHLSIRGDLVRVMQYMAGLRESPKRKDRRKAMIYFQGLEQFFQKKYYLDRFFFADISGRPLFGRPPLKDRRKYRTPSQKKEPELASCEGAF